MTLLYADIDGEYDKDENLKRDDIKILQEWMAKEAHLPKISELKIILFLQSCHYKIEAAKTCIENFYTIRTHCPEIFDNWDVKDRLLADQMKLLLVHPLPETKNRMIMVLRLMEYNADMVHIESAFKLFDTMTQLHYIKRGTAKEHIVLIDAFGCKLGHAFKFQLMPSKKFLYYVQEALPIRLTAIHVINISSATDKIFKILKPFIKGELLQLMHLHSSLESLYEHIPKEDLPKDIGGNAPSYKEMHAEQFKGADLYQQFLFDETMQRVDESKRSGKPKNMGDIFGIEGTFRKLEID